MPEYEVLISDYLSESETEKTTEEVEEETTADYSESLSEIIYQTNLINENLVAVQDQNDEILLQLTNCYTALQFTSNALALSMIIITAVFITKIFKSLL